MTYYRNDPTNEHTNTNIARMTVSIAKAFAQTKKKSEDNNSKSIHRYFKMATYFPIYI